MPRVYVGVGSNIERETNIRAGLKVLAVTFSPLTISTVYESKPLGFRGGDFYNLVVGFDSDLSALELVHIFKTIEAASGRKRDEPGFVAHTLDLDLLLYGELIQHDNAINVPRDDVSQFPFVLCPLAEIAGELEHPETGSLLKDMWDDFDKSKHPITAVTL